MLKDTLTNGSAYRKFEEMVEAQGGSLKTPLPKALHTSPVPALSSGFVTSVETEAIGWCCIALGGGV